MKATIQIDGLKASYKNGCWVCMDAALTEQLNKKCRGNWPGSEPDPGGQDISLALEQFGATLMNRTFDPIDECLVY